MSLCVFWACYGVGVLGVNRLVGLIWFGLVDTPGLDWIGLRSFTRLVEN
jgi:hypothetical protein